VATTTMRRGDMIIPVDPDKQVGAG
jgi:hypothetical protein